MWILIYIIFIIADIAVFLVPKKLSKSEFYTTSIFAVLFGISVDEVLDLHLNLYGYFKHGFQWQGFIGSFLYFIPTSFFFLNFFPEKKSWKYKVLYFLVWVIFSLCFEWCCLQTSFLYYNGWKLLYSALVYPIIFLCLIGNLKLFRKLNKK
ncbi:hypothetical protein [Bacillus sp. FJAT-49736]|uniref:hypothetical protein n=1 Tax=Bacillus sp. FJAT-49736 TaxID=2833582 RepID=UPI001BC9471A|nr:hypothetical protein [Bacillus sp. FJAT-49736]MBS4172139.1 hypothetical protein [Bacillus sp. FJAT-49736]